MFSLDDLGQAAEELRKRGIDAWHEFLYGSYGCVEGLDIEGEFFPRWELHRAENADDVSRADFAAIKRRRGSDWSMEPPMSMCAGG